MKNILVFIVLLTFSLMAKAQKTTAPNEFEKPVISFGVVVADLQKSIDFYTNVIGMVKTSSFKAEKDFTKRSGLNAGIEFDVTVLKLENSEAATEWKLMSFNKKASHPWQKYMTDDNGIQYVTIFVKSMKPILERIKKHNIQILSEPGLKLADGRPFVLVQDPDGTFIELIAKE